MFDIDMHFANTFLPRLTGISKDMALCYLTVAVENGLSKVREVFCKEEGKSKEEALEETKACTRQLLLFFSNTEALLEDDHFKMSLRLTVGNIINDLLKQKNSIDGWKNIFLSRLNEIFPPEYSAKFHEYTVKIIRADIEENGAAHWLPEWDAIEKYYAWRNQVKYCPPLPSKRPTRRAVKSAGVETWMAKCPNPNCKEEPKRMDKNSKRFRCKCGVNRAYPFK